MAEGTKGKIISVNKFAQEIGVSEGAVRKAIKNWKFTIGVLESGKIDPVAAKQDPWVQKQLLAKPQAGVSRAKATEKMEALTPATIPDQVNSPTIIDDIDLTSENVASKIRVNTDLVIGEAMRRREIVALAMDKKRLQEQEGVLVRRDLVEKTLFAFGNELKKALFNMPQRIVREIMAAPTEVEGISILSVELTQILEAFAKMKIENKSNG